jgi:hypothetical protein
LTRHDCWRLRIFVMTRLAALPFAGPVAIAPKRRSA